MKKILLTFFLAPFFCQAQMINLVAGNGTAAFGGDGGPAIAASFNEVCAVGFDTRGNIYIPDYYNNRIRRIDTSGIVTTVAGNGIGIFAGDGGPATAASLHSPDQVVFDHYGNMYISDRVNASVRKVDTSGNISTYAGNGMSAFSGEGGPATLASLVDPTGIAIDKYGNIYIANEQNRIRMVDTSGIIKTIAGTGFPGFSGDGGPATDAVLNTPTGIAVDTNGNVYVGDELNHRVRKIDRSGIITTIAGTGTAGNSGDGGPATAAEILSPWALTTDVFGDVYIGDGFNNVVRRIDAAGIISTLAGVGISGYSGDGGPASDAELYQPFGVSIDNSGNVYIADTYNNRLRKVSMPPSLKTAPLNLSTANIAIYPNPAHQQLTVIVNDRFTNLAISDISGKPLPLAPSPIGKNGFRFDISSLPCGVYQIQVDDVVKSFIKE